jgi:hypothetical protein
MSNNQTGEWSNLVVESSAHPPALPEDRFRDWMAGRRLFVSSRMDTEMNLAREAVRDYLHRMGASPVMWEEITPRDERAQRAYLDGVDRSSIFLLIIGSSYGTDDDSGYSPTYQKESRKVKSTIAPYRKIPVVNLKLLYSCLFIWLHSHLWQFLQEEH